VLETPPVYFIFIKASYFVSSLRPAVPIASFKPKIGNHNPSYHFSTHQSDVDKTTDIRNKYSANDICFPAPQFWPGRSAKA